MARDTRILGFALLQYRGLLSIARLLPQFSIRRLLLTVQRSGTVPLLGGRTIYGRKWRLDNHLRLGPSNDFPRYELPCIIDNLFRSSLITSEDEPSAFRRERHPFWPSERIRSSRQFYLVDSRPLPT